jgi:hypothetical protein
MDGKTLEENLFILTMFLKKNFIICFRQATHSKIQDDEIGTAKADFD